MHRIEGLPSKIVCEEKRRLLEAYQQVTARYSAAVTQLQRTMGTVSRAEYDSVYRMTETLHADVTKAQGELNSHVQEHRC
jgi:hypothetical protein